MKTLFKKVMIGVAGALALFGISVANVAASASDNSEISSKTALYLEHGKYIGSGTDTVNWHTSHMSHMSHESHASHVSHGSGY